MKKVLSILLVVVALGGCVATQDGDDNGELPDARVIPPLVQEDCFNDSVLYEVSGTSLKFCYKEEWGEPVVGEAAVDATGEKFSITFANSDAVSPVVIYSTIDFVEVDDDISSFDFDALNPVMPEDSLTADFVTISGLSEDDFSLRKVSVSGERGLRIHYDYGDIDVLSYYIPNAFEGYNLEISGSQELAVEIDDLAQLMISF